MQAGKSGFLVEINNERIKTLEERAEKLSFLLALSRCRESRFPSKSSLIQGSNSAHSSPEYASKSLIVHFLEAGIVEKNKVVVVGASNIDIKGRSVSAVYSRMKNPGRVEITAGGVGRNIAENLSRLGISTTLLTAIGRRDFSSTLKDDTERAGVDLSRVLFVDDKHSGIFMAVINQRGEMESSISDMSILTHITPEYIARNSDVFDDAGYVVIDADIPEETLALVLHLAKLKNIPVCVEPVSPAKAKGMLKYIGDITITTPNREEVEILVGKTIVSGEDIQQAGEELLNLGVRYVIITLGPEGVYCASREFSGFVSSISTLVVDSVGAGDALVSGVVTGFLSGMEFFEAVKLGVAAATLTLTTSYAVNPKMDIYAVRELVGRIKMAY
jgi:pseudouridine kinase